MAARFVVRAFEVKDQDGARQLILEGLKEHFGFLDDTLNRDLNDIERTYADSLFLVAVVDDRVVGTGCLRAGVDGDANVVRMSTLRSMRRQGVGRAILDRLIDHARKQGFTRATLGTNGDWADAIAFYQSCGFTEIARARGRNSLRPGHQRRKLTARVRLEEFPDLVGPVQGVGVGSHGSFG